MGRSTSTAAHPHLPVDDGPVPGEVLEVSLRRDSPALTSRVLGAGPGSLLLAPPVDVRGATSRLVAGEEADLVWTDADDVVGLPVVVERTGDADWSAVVVGPPQRVQRRGAVRVPMRARVVVVGLRRAGGDAEHDAVDGDGGYREIQVVDLSEGGARCLVDPSVLPLDQGTTVRLQLPVEVLPAPVEALVVDQRVRRGTPHVDVGLQFLGLSERDADALRHRVFTRMWELRRRGEL